MTAPLGRDIEIDPDRYSRGRMPLRSIVQPATSQIRQFGPMKVRPAVSSPRNCHSSPSTLIAAPAPSLYLWE
jgi:hypothetical protein